MDLNLILFPAPRSSYSIGRITGELVWIPKEDYGEAQSHSQRLITAPDFATSQYTEFTLTEQNVQEKYIDKAFIPLRKPQIKDLQSDEMSNVSTDSSKKLSKGKPESQHEQTDPKNSSINSDDDGEILSEHKNSFHHNSHKKMTATHPKDENHPDIDIFSCNEGVRLNSIHDYYIRTPNTSNLQRDVHVPKLSIGKIDNGKSADRNIHTERPTLTNYFSQSKGGRVSNNENNTSLISFVEQEDKPNKVEQSCRSQHFLSGKKESTIPKLKLKLDASQSEFDLENTNEDDKNNKKLLYTPRTVTDYSTRALQKPVNKQNVKLPAKNKVEDYQKSGLSRNRIPRERAPLTDRFDCEGRHHTTTSFIAPNRPNINVSLLSPRAYEEAVSRYHVGSEEIESREKIITARFGMDQPVLKQLGSATHRGGSSSFIPCLLLRCAVSCSKLLVYFHGNGEDINLAKELLRHLRDTLNVHVLAVEYPGYGLYKGTATEEKILEDSESVYEYLITALRMKPEDIILFGRSIGSGPATYLASKRKVGALILMSAFTSIKAVVKDMAGSWAQHLIKQRFNNLEAIKQVVCPTFIIHGQKDRVVPFQHSKQLHEACQAPCELILPKNMNHTEFEFHGDFTKPLINFLERCSISLESQGISGKIYFPKKFFEVPGSFRKQRSMLTTRT